VQIASIPEEIRGFGHVKERHFDAELLVDLPERQIVDLVVHDDAERAVVVVLAHKNHAFLEALVGHRRRGDQEAADQGGGGSAGPGHDNMIPQLDGDCPVKGQGRPAWTKSDPSPRFRTV
jgi:hypothetical protein